MKSQAEEKLLKFEETQTGSAEGNHEPSSIQGEGVETRRAVCIWCSGQIPEHKYKSAKYCSKKCRVAAGSYRHAVKHGKIKKPGVGSGGNQWGKNNSQYKTGIGSFRQKALEHYGNMCNRCGKTRKYMDVHHKDENRTNNSLSNLEVLCRSCHRQHHAVRDKSGKFISPKHKEIVQAKE